MPHHLFDNAVFDPDTVMMMGARIVAGGLPGAEVPEAANHRSDHQHADRDFGHADGEVQSVGIVTEVLDAVAEHDDRRHGVLELLDEHAPFLALE